MLAGTTLAGPSSRHELAGDNAFAVYFNDITGGKLDTYPRCRDRLETLPAARMDVPMWPSGHPHQSRSRRRPEALTRSA